MEIKINKNVVVAKNWEEDITLRQIVIDRRMMQLNPQKDINENSLSILTLNDTTIFKRMTNNEIKVEKEKGTIEYTEDGTRIVCVPVTDEEKKFGKEQDIFILHPDMIIIIFKFSTKNLTEQIKNAPYLAIVNLFKNKNINKYLIEVARNDILINEKKIVAADLMANDFGVYQFIAINYIYDENFFKKYLNKSQLNRKTGAGITGVLNEFPGYDKEDFINDFIAEFKNIINEVE